MIRSSPNGARCSNLAFSCILMALSAKIHSMQPRFHRALACFTLLSGYTKG
jgi:hypothetical protein